MSTIAELFRQALSHHKNGDLGLAENLCRQILQADPSHGHAWHVLGLLAGQAGRADLAAEYMGEALRFIPDFAPAHYNLGMVHAGQGRLAEGENCYRQALHLQPSFAEAHCELGIVLCGQGNPQEAEASFLEALRLKPGYAEPHNNLGNIRRDQGQLANAETCFRQALRLKPSFAEARANLGLVLWDQGKLADAEACCQEALRLQPRNAETHNNLGNIHRDQGEPEKAEACFREALELKPDFADAHLNLSLLLLLQGDFALGWPEYEWRWQIKNKLRYVLPAPTWGGDDLHGQNILLQAEQGFGDTIQFVRFARLLKAKGGLVLLHCPAALARILAGCPGIDQLVDEAQELPAFDVSAPLMSLPMLCGTTLATIPADVPYLFADHVLIARWRQELSAYSGFKIGIVWQGNPRFSQPLCRIADRRRSIGLAQFEPLARLPGVRLFSLQKGFGSEQLADWGRQWKIVDLGEQLHDFMDTAAVMMNLDLIISADTAPAHLAGALGRPVWTALPFAGCWRWLLNREDTPWYPTMRLFRQRKPGDWADVFQRMAREIQVLNL